MERRARGLETIPLATVPLPQCTPVPVPRDRDGGQDHQGDEQQGEGVPGFHLLALRQPRLVGVEAERTAEEV